MEEVRPLALRVTRRAFAHMLDIETEVSRVRKGSAKGVGARFRASFEFLSRHPGVGRPGRRGTTREWIVPDLPVIVVYRVRAAVLEIVGVYPGVLTEAR